MTTSGSPGHKTLYPSAHIGEHSLNVHPSGFALLLMICVISTPVSISINDRSNRVASKELASRNDADGRCLARAFWHGHSGSMSFARGRTKKYTNQRNQGCEKEKKVMIVAPQLDSADSLFTAQYAALIGPPSCFFFCFFSERLNIYRHLD